MAWQIWPKNSSKVALLSVLGLLGCSAKQPKLPTYQCTQPKIIDGDSIVALCPSGETRLRLNCIDAPELKQRHFGREAKQALASMVDEPFTVTDWGLDRYNRVLADIYVDGQSVQRQMIEQGAAVVYRHYCLDEHLLDVEQRAIEQKVGVWRERGLQQTPWRWRQLQPPRD